MSLNPLAIALQGVGFTADLTALQGLIPVTITVVERPQGGGTNRRKRAVGLRPGVTVDSEAEVLELLMLAALAVEGVVWEA